MTKCPTCGAASLAMAVCSERIELAGEVFTAADVPCERCAECGEELVSYEERARFELGVAAELARRGRRTGTALRFMRKALGFRAAELAALLAVAPETFSRWENGEREPEPRAFALVGMLAHERLAGHGDEALTMLRAMREPAAPTSEPVRLRIAV